MFITLLIVFILFILFIILYYAKIKKVKNVGKIKYCYNSVLSFILIMVNKISKSDFIAITNPLTNRIHLIDKNYYDNITEEDFLYKHELVHVYQVEILGKIKFLFLYFVYSIKYGYYNNPFEKQAREHETKNFIIKSDIEKEINNNFHLYE
ncbi:hypothetical protein [Brachyspira pulli]|uniref:hypothetical protein n=1 Tax=Brachyspira pulli TaxID=310721 RepID=UPI00300676EA